MGRHYDRIDAERGVGFANPEREAWGLPSSAVVHTTKNCILNSRSTENSHTAFLALNLKPRPPAAATGSAGAGSAAAGVAVATAPTAAPAAVSAAPAAAPAAAQTAAAPEQLTGAPLSGAHLSGGEPTPASLREAVAQAAAARAATSPTDGPENGKSAAARVGLVKVRRLYLAAYYPLPTNHHAWSCSRRFEGFGLLARLVCSPRLCCACAH